eukprot:gene15845-18102_t
MLHRLLVALAVFSVVFAKDVYGSLSILNDEVARTLNPALNSTQRMLADGSGKKDVCTIVVRDKIRGHLNWMQDWFIKAAQTKCNQAVVITENNVEAKTANVLLYHAPSHMTINNLRASVPNKKAIFAMISMEQPKYAPVLSNFNYLNSNIDLLLTYSLSDTYPGSKVANLPITYYPFNIVSPMAVIQPARSFKDKNGYNTGVTVAIFASNCKNAGASTRYKFIEELMKHLQVHSYGKCLNNRQEPGTDVIPEDPRWPAVAQRRARKIKILSQYKFYLAFENLSIEDYVSEKVFEGLIAGTLPVYKGAPSIHKFMPHNNSYIDANAMDPKQLADKLTFLASNQEEYNKYFAFKSQALSKDFEDMALMSYVHPNVVCRLCDYAMNVKK